MSTLVFITLIICSWINTQPKFKNGDCVVVVTEGHPMEGKLGQVTQYDNHYLYCQTRYSGFVVFDEYAVKVPKSWCERNSHCQEIKMKDWTDVVIVFGTAAMIIASSLLIGSFLSVLIVGY